MKYKCVFSIPVHERPDVIIDQIINISYFNPCSAIVLHISRQFSDEKSLIPTSAFLNVIKKFDNVYINPESVRTGFLDIIQAHISNFNHIRDKVDFDYFSLLSSNELFITHGAEDFVYQYDAGLKKIGIDDDRLWMGRYLAKKDKSLTLICMDACKDDTNYKGLFRSQVEGSFFKKNIFSAVCESIESHYDYKNPKNLIYAREEVYFSSYLFNSEKKLNIYLNNLTFNADNSPSWHIYNNDYNRIIHEGKYFSIKRIPRDIYDPRRIIVRKPYLSYEMKIIPITDHEANIEEYDSRYQIIDLELKKKRKTKVFLKRIAIIRFIYGNLVKKA